MSFRFSFLLSGILEVTSNSPSLIMYTSWIGSPSLITYWSLWNFFLSIRYSSLCIKFLDQLEKRGILRKKSMLSLASLTSTFARILEKSSLLRVANSQFSSHIILACLGFDFMRAISPKDFPASSDATLLKISSSSKFLMDSLPRVVTKFLIRLDFRLPPG